MNKYTKGSRFVIRASLVALALLIIASFTPPGQARAEEGMFCYKDGEGDVVCEPVYILDPVVIDVSEEEPEEDNDSFCKVALWVCGGAATVLGDGASRISHPMGRMAAYFGAAGLGLGCGYLSCRD
jgi:hypothetical protein